MGHKDDTLRPVLK